ncbi:MAG: serine--tRNA ligase, partial [Chloroflexota bacterium]
MSVGLQRLREEPEVIRQGALDKGEDASLVDAALELDARRRRLLGEADGLKAERNRVSKQIGEAVRATGHTASGTGTAHDATVGTGPTVAALKAASVAAGERIAVLDAEAADVEAELEDVMLRIPNPADADVPVGDADANVVVRTWGELLPRVQHHAGEVGADADATAGTWERKPHWEIAEALDIIDLERGAKITGSGFPVYKGAGAALQRALIDFFLGVHTRENGFTEIWPPIVVNTASARGTGQIPDKEDQMYVVTRDELYLVPTAEVPVTNLHRDEIFEADALPVRYAAYTPCFRREAGAAGKDTRGILRVHQFDKVEMVLFERPEASNDALEWMTGRAEDLLRRLGLAYRVLLMATRDMGFVQARKYDLEVWAPGVERWLEVSSCSNFRDYQARRMAIRHRPA